MCKMGKKNLFKKSEEILTENYLPFQSFPDLLRTGNNKKLFLRKQESSR